MQDARARRRLGEEGVRGAKLTVFGDATLVEEGGRSRRLKLVTVVDVEVVLKMVLGSYLPADLIFKVTQVFLLVHDLVDQVLSPALHLLRRVVHWVELIEHGAKLGENVQSLLRRITRTMGG